VIKKLLLNLGYSNISIVDNGQKAYEAAKRQNFKIILMDCMMPIVSGNFLLLYVVNDIGLEATQRIRNELIQQPTIIALTANAYEENSKNCLACGMNGIIHKP
jgi:CheY-like chemotaxis protein